MKIVIEYSFESLEEIFSVSLGIIDPMTHCNKLRSMDLEKETTLKCCHKIYEGMMKLRDYCANPLHSVRNELTEPIVSNEFSVNDEIKHRRTFVELMSENERLNDIPDSKLSMTVGPTSSVDVLSGSGRHHRIRTNRDSLVIDKNFLDVHHFDYVAFIKTHYSQGGKFLLVLSYVIADFMFRLIPTMTLFRFVAVHYESPYKRFGCNFTYLLLTWIFELTFFHFCIINKSTITRVSLFKYSFPLIFSSSIRTQQFTFTFKKKCFEICEKCSNGFVFLFGCLRSESNTYIFSWKINFFKYLIGTLFRNIFGTIAFMLTRKNDL